MIERFKNIFKSRKALQTEDRLNTLIENNNIRVGVDCSINNLNIFHYEVSKDFCNVFIGDESFLENNVTLYSSQSKVRIGNRVYIGPNTNINCYKEVEIGDDVMFAWGCTVMDTNAHSLKWEGRVNDVINWKKGWQYKDWSVVESKKIKIGNKCWVGFNSIILKGVELGEGCVVAAGSVITKSFAPYSVIGGNPAILIKTTE